MRNVGFWISRISLVVLIISVIVVHGGRQSSKTKRTRDRSRNGRRIDFNRNRKNDILTSTYAAGLQLEKDRDRGYSRQIQPLNCKVPDSDLRGICMFVFDCNRANGTHLGICRDGFYIGSCCKLPDRIPPEDEKTNEIDTSSGTKPTSSSSIVVNSTSAIVEIVTESSKLTIKPTTTPTTTTTAKPLNRTELRDSEFFSENGTVLIGDPKLICGRQFLPASRIVGGNNAYYGKWPWQISLRTWQNDARTFIHSCGATLLNENWAITAAHCVDKVLIQDLILRIGEFDLSDDNVPFNYTERRVQLVIPHPRFFGPAKTFEYDLALIRFYEPVKFQPNIVPICIPETEDDYVGRTGVVTGWGRLYEGGPIPARLNEVQVPIMNNTNCEKMFLKAGYQEKIPHIFLCAGWPDGEKDSCEGDSGGPMVLETGADNHWTLAGVISWGIGCSRVSHPGVYTRITEFRDWINLVSEF